MAHIVSRPELAAAAYTFVAEFLDFKVGDRVCITTDTARDASVVDALLGALLAAGCRPSTITLPQLPFQGKLADPYLPSMLEAALREIDVWIDLTFPYVAGSAVHSAFMTKESARYVLGSDLSAEGLIRLFGPDVLGKVYEEQSRFESLIARSKGERVRVTTPLGTDFSFELAEATETSQRTAGQPGLHFLPGSCFMSPEIESVKGQIVFESVFHEFYTWLHEPMSVKVDGRIRSVRGGGSNEIFLDRALRRAGGGEYGYVIHATHGIHPAARFAGNCFVEDLRAIGCNAIGMGLPFWVPEGGENHPDAVISMQSIWLGETLIVDRGRTVIEHL